MSTCASAPVCCEPYVLSEADEKAENARSNRVEAHSLKLFKGTATEDQKAELRKLAKLKLGKGAAKCSGTSTGDDSAADD